MRLNINGKSFEAEQANTLFTRFKGLLGRKSMQTDSAMVIYPCSSVHTCFMQFPIDVVFLNKEHRILKVVRNMVPYRFTSLVWGAYYAVEVLGGILPPDMEKGQLILFEGGGSYH